MSRPLTAAAALACALALAGCQTAGAPVVVAGAASIVIDTTKLPAVVARAQARVVQACGFLPTAQTVTSIIKTFRPSTRVTIDLVETVVGGVCAAANGGAYASAKSARAGTYRGVRIRGRFVNQENAR